ncbi:MAG: HAD-IA family hydrolase [Candidatus Saccharimonadales bacterium]
MSSVIFDFDGTIADSLPVIMHLFYKWSKREPFSSSEIETLREMPAREVIKAVGVPIWRAPALLARGRKDFTKHISEIKIFDGIADMLADLHSRGYKIYLMSTNSHHNIHEYVKLHKLDKYFDEIYGGVGLFGKASTLKKIVSKHHIVKSECYSVGDESRDIDAAKKAGLISVAVTWGFNGQTILKQHQPDYLVSKPAELTKLLQ